MNLTAHWYKKNLVSFVLLPLAGIYRFCVCVRKIMYRCGILKTHHFHLPIVVVGNITTGGTGKTPLVVALAKYLKQQGYAPGIVSRGYGGKAKFYPQQINDLSDAQQVGDEAILLFKKTHCPVVVAPRRIDAVRKLINESHVNIVLCDDGLQHYSLYRDIDIAVIDGRRQFGNGFCLPAGPLREPVSRLRKLNYVIMHQDSSTQNNTMSLTVNTIYNLIDNNKLLPLDKLHHEPIHAVAGIGHPERFFTTLRQLNFKIIEHRFPDHHQFKQRDFDFGDDYMIIMTEKDAVKCQKFARHAMWVLSVSAELNPAFLQSLIQDISTISF